MKLFRAQTPEDITQEDLDAIANGEYVEDPKDGVQWDAADARRARQVMMEDGTWTDDYVTERVTLNHWTVKVAAILCLVLAVLFICSGVFTVKSRVDYQTFDLNGVAYECAFVDEEIDHCKEVK
jgi:hypothetical protein